MKVLDLSHADPQSAPALDADNVGEHTNVALRSTAAQQDPRNRGNC